MESGAPRRISTPSDWNEALDSSTAFATTSCTPRVCGISSGRETGAAIRVDSSSRSLTSARRPARRSITSSFASFSTSTWSPRRTRPRAVPSPPQALRPTARSMRRGALAPGPRRNECRWPDTPRARHPPRAGLRLRPTVARTRRTRAGLQRHRDRLRSGRVGQPAERPRDRVADEVVDVAGLAEADFVLGGVHVDVDRGGSDAEMEHERRILRARERVPEPDPDRVAHDIVAHAAPVDEEILTIGTASRRARRGEESAQRQIAGLEGNLQRASSRSPRPPCATFVARVPCAASPREPGGRRGGA